MNDDEEADLRVDIENKELKNLNRQYFRNILRLEKDYGTLEFACILELIIIVVLLLVIVL